MTSDFGRRRSTHRMLVLSVAVFVSFGAMAAADADTPPRYGTVRGVVAFVGDSNAVFSAQYPADELLNRMRGYAVVNVARGGSSIRFVDCRGCTDGNFWRTRIEGLKDRMSPDVYVVNFGINDTGHPGAKNSYGYANYDDKIDWLMDLFDGKPVLWTNLPCDIEPDERQKGCNVVNGALADARSRWPNLIVLGWNLIASDHPEYLGPPNGIHLTESGGIAWSEMVARSIDARIPLD